MSGISDRNPFVGPRPIQQGEPLYGRATEVRKLYSRLQARRIVVLHSPSGAGKSSLVQAGLVPKLRASKFDVWKTIRVNLDPAGLDGVPEGTNRYLLSAIVSLEAELPEARRRSPAELAGFDLLPYLEGRPRRRGREQRPVVLLFDQFEEVLTVAPQDVSQKRAFFSAVGEALGTEKYWALFMIRDDFLAAFAPYRDRIPTQMSNTFRLDLLGREGAREAVEQPALEGGRSFPAVDQLIRDLSTTQVQQPDGSFVAEQGLYVEPVQLQVVCRRLWEAMPDDALSITEHDIKQYAEVSESLGGYYSQAVEKIARGNRALERVVREWVGDKLIMGGIRSQVRQEANHSAGLDNDVVEQLLSSYLVRGEQRAGATWFELSHDRLVEPVQRDNDAWEREHLHPMQVQAKSWEAGRRAAALLLSVEAFPGARSWAKNNPALLTDGEREFLELSQGQRTQEAQRLARERGLRRLGRIATASVAMSAVMALLVVWALSEKRRAESAERHAERSSERAEREERNAIKAKNKAEMAALIAGARELLTRGQVALASEVLAEVKDPNIDQAMVGMWAQVATDILVEEMPEIMLSHERQIYSAAWSPDGERIVTASADGTARVWNIDGSRYRTLHGHTGEVTSAAWSPDGARIVTTSKDKTAWVWGVKGAGEPIVLRGHKGGVSWAAWSPDGARIVTASKDKTARVWNTSDGSIHRILEGHEGGVISAAWSFDGERIVTVSVDKKARVWTVDGPGEPLLLEGHGEQITFAAWSHRDERIVTVSKDNTARVWSVGSSDDPSPPTFKALEGHLDWVLGAAWSGDDEQIITVSADKTARVWSADGIGEPIVLEGHESWVWDAAWSDDGKRIVTASADKTARVWDIDGSEDPLVLEGHQHDVTSVAWSPDNERILTASWDKTAQIWNPDGSVYPRVLEGHEKVILSTAWSHDNSHILTASEDETARIWNIDGSEFRSFEGVTFATWSSDDMHILTTSKDRTARIWSVHGTEDPTIFAGHEDEIWSAAWSHDDQRIVTTSRDKSVRVWRAGGSDKDDPTVLRGHTEGVKSAAWSPDNTRIVTTSNDNTARVWNADGSNKNNPVILRGHLGDIRSAMWSPDGKRILTASADGTARVWIADNSEESIILRGHTRGVRVAVWSPDSPDGKRKRRILTASEDGTTRVWDATNLEEEPIVLVGHDDVINSAVWSHDGELILTASYDETARVWNADGLGAPTILGGHDHHVTAAEWSSDGHRIVTASDRTARVWVVAPTVLREAIEQATTTCLTPAHRRAYLYEGQEDAGRGDEDCADHPYSDETEATPESSGGAPYQSVADDNDAETELTPERRVLLEARWDPVRHQEEGTEEEEAAGGPGGEPDPDAQLDPDAQPDPDAADSPVAAPPGEPEPPKAAAKPARVKVFFKNPRTDSMAIEVWIGAKQMFQEPNMVRNETIIKHLLLGTYTLKTKIGGNSGWKESEIKVEAGMTYTVTITEGKHDIKSKPRAGR